MKNSAISRLIVVPTLCGLAAVSAFSQGCGSSEKKDGTTFGQGGSAGNSGGGASNLGGAPILMFGGRTGSDAAGSGGDSNLCGGDEVKAAPAVVNLLFVIDRSQSMESIPTGFTTSKWQAMVTSLKQALEGVRGKMAVGLQFFPDAPEGSADARCGMPLGAELTVPVAAGDVAVNVIEEKLDESLPTGSTPTADALALAGKFFSAGAGASLEGKKYVLLALDGGPNCNEALSCGEDTLADRARCTQTYDKPESCGATSPFNCCNQQGKGCLDAERVVGEVERLRDAGIVTIVVGIPGSEPYAEVLDALADKGGAAASATSPKYFKVEDPASLTAALGALTLDLIKTCELQLESEPPAADKVNVYLDGVVVPQLGDDGWELDSSTAPPIIRLKGATCAGLEKNGAKSISAEFGCPTILVPL
jgi:hypothetical protein